MAWITPQAFIANEVLTAAKMNQLVDAIAFLNGLAAGPLPPFSVAIGTEASTTFNYFVRHRSRYLHVVYWSNGAYYLRVKVNGVTRHEVTNPADGNNDVVLDTNSYGLTLGDFASIDVTMQADNDKEMRLQYLTELATNTALV